MHSTLVAGRFNGEDGGLSPGKPLGDGILCDRLLKAAVQRLQLSARAYHRVLKLALTIADLSGADHIETPHLAEALQYRPMEGV